MNDANAKADALVKDAKGRSETLVKSYEKQIAAKEKEAGEHEARGDKLPRFALRHL